MAAFGDAALFGVAGSRYGSHFPPPRPARHDRL